MSRYLTDLHIHSCLSPCGDDDMTPGNIAGMAVLNGLQIVALTDHRKKLSCLFPCGKGLWTDPDRRDGTDNG